MKMLRVLFVQCIILDQHKLHDEVLTQAKPGTTNCVFIDEMQNVPGFQRAVDSLYTHDGSNLSITGSNALMLKDTLATLLPGRYVLELIWCYRKVCIGKVGDMEVDFVTKEAAVGFEETIAEKIEEFAARCREDGKISPSFDVWDYAAIDYLKELQESLAQGESATVAYERLKADLPRLEEEAERESVAPTFDLYDDHYHEKVCCGHLEACKVAIQLFEASLT
jgi:hypothetical protein